MGLEFEPPLFSLVYLFSNLALFPIQELLLSQLVKIPGLHITSINVTPLPFSQYSPFIEFVYIDGCRGISLQLGPFKILLHRDNLKSGIQKVRILNVSRF